MRQLSIIGHTWLVGTTSRSSTLANERVIICGTVDSPCTPVDARERVPTGFRFTEAA